MRTIRALFSSLLLLGLLSQAVAVDTLRSEEINECRSNEIATWADGKDRPAIASPLIFAFAASAAPTWFEAEQTLSMIRQAADAWSQCGIASQVIHLQEGMPLPPGAIRIHWDDKESRGNFGLAHLGTRTLSLAPGAFALLRQRNPSYDSRQTLQMVLSHEMGHFYGLMAHSRRCIDVLSYYHNDKGEQCFTRNPAQRHSVLEYRHSLPTACDIERCRRANGLVSR